MAASQKPNTHSASMFAAAWSRVPVWGCCVGKPVAARDTEEPLSLPIAVTDHAAVVSPAAAHGPAGDVFDLTPETIEKLRVEAEIVQHSEEAPRVQLPRLASPPVEQVSPPVGRGNVSNVPMSSCARLKGRVQPPRPLSPLVATDIYVRQGRIHPGISRGHLQLQWPATPPREWEPKLVARRPAWLTRGGVSIPQVVHASEAICEVTWLSFKQSPHSISVKYTCPFVCPTYP